MQYQLEFKDEVFLVSLKMGITPAYKLANGTLYDREQYNNKVWETSPYDKEDFYLQEFIGDGYFIKSQTKVVKTLEEAKEFIKQQKRKLIAEKHKEIKKLEDSICNT